MQTPTSASNIQILLIHGMGRTPLSMLRLHQRLKARGFSPKLFGYSPTFESFEACMGRLAAHILETTGGHPYALAGHSLGTVLIRGVLPRLAARPPLACFFLAPPTQACRATRFFAGNPLYKLLMGEMGQLLADPAFMAALAYPQIPCRIYAGTAGPTGRFSPFGDEPNDGILSVEEMRGPAEIPVVITHSSHTFIMNSRQVADDIANTLDGLQATA